MEHNHQNDNANYCEVCRNKHEFDFPSQLFKSLLEGKVVIFAGAGVSTENRLVFPITFYENICEELGIETTEGLSFPNVMSKYCEQPNGRQMLLHKIKQRLEYVKSFPEIYRTATRFHNELSTIAPIDTIITTNWDNYFEQECGATPFTSAEDFAFWNLPGRKVFKIHGSVDSYGSIVATREDYEKCYERLSTGLLGSSLKMMLATKTILYIGFSFTDDDFLRIHKILTAEMQGLRPHSYIVTLDRGADERLKEHGLTPIYTDGTHFLTVLKKHLFEQEGFITDDRFDGIMLLLAEVISKHAELAEVVNPQNHPEVIYSLSYQDGLIHALERILALRKTGHYSHVHNLHIAINSYASIRKEKLKSRNYVDIAYIDGYIDGLIYLLALDDERKGFWIYYIFGYKDPIPSLKAYLRLAKKSSEIHNASYKLAQKIIKKRNLSKEITFHHIPFL